HPENHAPFPPSPTSSPFPMSAASSDLLRLFTELALAARCPNAGARHADAAAAASTAPLPSLVASFKPKPDVPSGSRVLDAALSLMCFRSPQVYGSTIDSIVKTMVSVLLSSVSCKVDRLDKKDAGILRVGSSICSADREKLLRVCIDVARSLKGHVANSCCTEGSGMGS
ncbi:hypothetical protein Taro_052747, partial [Colocasia esculenta]|nr:hypothetical protein [Colocasia esculenta]